MRTDVSRVDRRDVQNAIRDLLPHAAAWLGGHDVAMPPGSLGGSEGLEKLAEMSAEGLAPDIRATLTTFALRLGARRRADAATALAMIGEHAAANVLQQQAQVIGAAQYHAVIGEDAALADAFRQLAGLHDTLREHMRCHLS